MKNYKILIVMFLVIGLIGSIRSNSPAYYGDLFSIHVNVNNEGQKDLDDLKVKVYFYDLGVLLQTNPFDLDNGDSTGKFIFWDVPDEIPSGEYLVRITVSNDDIREVKHRFVNVA